MMEFATDGPVREEHVQAAAEWLLSVPWRKTADLDCPSSYGLKHEMERETGVYVHNDEFVAAARRVGVPMKDTGRNPAIGVSAKRRTNSARGFHPFAAARPPGLTPV